MKKVFVMLMAIAVMLFIAACGTESTPASNNDNETPQAESPAPEAPEPPQVEAQSSPEATISAFFGYLNAGNVLAADAIFIHSNGDFAEVAIELYDDLGVFVFQDISYSNLSYTVNGDNATATFDMVNVDFFQTSFDVGFQLGVDGLIDVEASDEDIEALIMPLIGEMISTGTAPTFEENMEVRLRLIDNQWRIVDDNASLEFFMAVLGMI